MRNLQFANDYIYHIYNRGVEKRDVFMDRKDYFRFIHDLFEFNDIESAVNIYYKQAALQSYEAKPRKIGHKRKLLVEILAFCLMPNHFHLILRQLKEDGITLFMQKLGTGYTVYFNQKYQRAGSLFQGPFKAVLVETDTYLTHLSRYIHLNPLELFEPAWKQEGIKDWEKSNEFLETYRWASYLDYIGKKNFPSVTNRDFILQYFNGAEDYKKFINEWISAEFAKVEDFIIEK